VALLDSLCGRSKDVSPSRVRDEDVADNYILNEAEKKIAKNGQYKQGDML